MNSLPRWLISITDMPDPCQSSISEAACASTSSGSTAGPALKLKIRVSGLLPILFVLFLLLVARDGVAGEGGDALADLHVRERRVLLLEKRHVPRFGAPAESTTSAESAEKSAASIFSGPSRFPSVPQPAASVAARSDATNPCLISCLLVYCPCACPVSSSSSFSATRSTPASLVPPSRSISRTPSAE